MEERESTTLVLLPYLEEVPSTWKGEVQEKLTPSQLKDVGRKETSEGKHIGQGTVYSSFPGGLITNWLWLQKSPDVCGRDKNIGLLAHIPGDTRGR